MSFFFKLWSITSCKSTLITFTWNILITFMNIIDGPIHLNFVKAKTLTASRKNVLCVHLVCNIPCWEQRLLCQLLLPHPSMWGTMVSMSYCFEPGYNLYVQTYSLLRKTARAELKVFIWHPYPLNIWIQRDNSKLLEVSINLVEVATWLTEVGGLQHVKILDSNTFEYIGD